MSDVDLKLDASEVGTTSGKIRVAGAGGASILTLTSITGLTGGTATDLDGIVTLSQTLGATPVLEVNGISYIYRLDSGTDAESVPIVIRPDDYAASTNEKVWRLQGAWRNGKPLHWNSEDSAFHEVTVGLSATSLATSFSSPIFVPSKTRLDTALGVWKFNETDVAGTSNARDMLGTYHLTQNNTIPSTSGISGNARLFTLANTEYFSRTAGTHPFAFGDSDFTVTAWVKLTTAAATQALVCVYNTTGNQRCWYLGYDNGVNRFRFNISATGTSTVGTVDFGSAPSTGIWYFITARHDSVNNLISISMTAQGSGSRSASVTAAHTTGAFSGSTADFTIGALHGGGSPANVTIDEVAVYNSALSTLTLDDLYTNPGL